MLDENVADVGDPRDLRDDAVDLGRADRPGDIRAVEQHRVRAPIADRGWADRDADLPRQLRQARAIVGIDPATHRRECDRAVHRARIQEEIAEPFGHERADRALPRPSGTVDRDRARRPH